MQITSKKIQTFTQLDAWKQSHKLTVAVFEKCKALPKHDALRNQMERCGISITSNIAEGFGRQSLQDKKHFYIMARGSIYELQNQLLLARDTKRLVDTDYKDLFSLSLDSVRLLHGLIRSLGKTNS